MGDECYIIFDCNRPDGCFRAVVARKDEDFYPGGVAVHITDTRSGNIVYDKEYPKEPGIYYQIFSKNNITELMANTINYLDRKNRKNTIQILSFTKKISALREQIEKVGKQLKDINAEINKEIEEGKAEVYSCTSDYERLKIYL